MTRLSIPALLAGLALAIGGCGQHGAHSMSEFAADKDFHAAHTLRPTQEVALKGETVEITVPGGESAQAYWTGAKEPKAAIVMIHEWWGLNQHIKETADKLAVATGVPVLAIDLYEGQVATTREDAAKFMQGVSEARAQSVVKASLAALTQGGLAKATKIGTTGYCFGGGWSHRTAILGGKDVAACVIYYGMPVTDEAQLAKLEAPVMMVWPNKDRWINAEAVERFKAAMEKAGKPLEVLEYDADHAFANPSSASYASEAAEDAWAKTVKFFNEKLR
jgi:carboxymethylenebutenolidase